MQETKALYRPTIASLVITILTAASILPVIHPEPAYADSSVLKWHQTDTPGSVVDKNDIASPTEVNRTAIGSDGKTFYSVDIANADAATGRRALYKSTDSGKSWDDKIGEYLYQSMTVAEQANFCIWNVAMAPDDVNFVAAVSNNATSNLPHNIWISTNGGVKWENTNFTGVDTISTIDISQNYNTHNISVGTRTGTGTGRVWMLRGPDNSSWIDQAFSGDIMCLKFSTSYTNDFAITLVYSDATGTYVTVGLHDPSQTSTNWSAVYGGTPPEITAGNTGTSAMADQIITADIELPSDFSGQSPSLRRLYVSIDDAGISGQAGIYRLDDTNVYELMLATAPKRICSITYHGTFASGKLLVGEVLGNPCSAKVMSWFTDSPTTCPIPCWYPALKPATGAAGSDNCTGSGYGNAQVAWSPDGAIAYMGTASSAILVAGADWPIPYLTGQALDESAFSLSRNNGETWNQIALIDTRIDQFHDIAPSPDCSTIYLTSISINATCSGFDSVWRSQSIPLGDAWERVLCQPTTDQDCTANQTDNAILGMSGDKPDGSIVFWAAVGTTRIMWSPDFGDYWININTRFEVQDFAPEDSKTLYTLSPDGSVQKFLYSGTGWTFQQSRQTNLYSGYSIASAYTGITPDNYKGHIIVGGIGLGFNDVAFSSDGGDTFNVIPTLLPTRGNTLVVASSSYKSDGYILAINSGGMYAWSIYSGDDEWEIWWGGPSWPSPVTSLTISRNYSFYFTEPPSLWAPSTPYIRWSSAYAGLDPAISLGMPDQPTRRFKICGGIELGDPVNVWMIDQQAYAPPQGGVWRYTDTLLWNGPLPIQPITKGLVNCDPATGRLGQLDLKWQPVSLSRGYRVQIAKDENFALVVADIGSDWAGPFYTPPDLDSPAMRISPGGTVVDVNANTWTIAPLEANHDYYWRVRVQDVCTTDAIKSPWSWREIFRVRPGLPINTHYIGPQLLSPDNGCLDCTIKPVSFSWSPFQETTTYRFVLAKDPAMTDIIVDTETNITAYEFNGTLEYNSTYFWHIKAVEQFPSDWSPTFCFQTESAPIPTVPDATPAIPAWILVIIILGLTINILLLILILRRRSLNN